MGKWPHHRVLSTITAANAAGAWQANNAQYTYSEIAYVRMGQHLLPSKVPLLMGNCKPYLIHGSLDQLESTSQAASRLVQPFQHSSYGCLQQTTLHGTWHVYQRPASMHCMRAVRLNNNIPALLFFFVSSGCVDILPVFYPQLSLCLSRSSHTLPSGQLSFTCACRSSSSSRTPSGELTGLKA